MRTCAASLMLAVCLVVRPLPAAAQPKASPHFEVDVTGPAAAGAYVVPVADSRYSLGGRVGFSWDWATWGGGTFAHPAWDAVYADVIGRAEFDNSAHQTFLSLEAGPMLMHYNWGDDGSGSGLLVGVHVGGGVGWRRVSAGINARLGYTFNRLGNAPILPYKNSWGMLFTPYVRIAF